MNFGEAIEAMKNGKMVTRVGWNGKGMYLWYMPPATIKAEWCKEPHLKALAEANGGEIECMGSVRMKTADNKVVTGWVASQADMFAEDWMIYGENDNSEADVSKLIAHDDWNYRGVRFVRANVCPIGWEDADVDGESDDEDNPRIPCVEDGRWNILIDIKTGHIVNWKQGVFACVCYKVVDDGIYTMYDNGMEKIDEYDGYVPNLMSLDDEGWGDYINIRINEDGFIEDWPDTEDIRPYIDELFEKC